jgi:NDP-sugar pyrophosphorylase family protein
MTAPVTAVMLAGGTGSRLGSLTAVIPKPLVPIGREAIAEILLRQLARHGVERVVVSTGYLGHLIQAVLGDGSRFGLDIAYVHENQPLSTVGPLWLVDAQVGLPDTFLVLNGDVLTDLDFAALLAEHQTSQRLLTVATYARSVKIDLGVLERGADGVVTGFREKPTYDFRVSMGVYGMRRAVLDHVPQGLPFGFDQLMRALLQKGEPIGTLDWSHGRWLDIGRPDDFALAQELVVSEPGAY